MKYLIISIFLTVFSLPTYAAVGWFYTDELRAIVDALDRDKIDKTRGSYLKSLEKTPVGFKALVSGCTIFLDKELPSSIERGMTGANPQIRFRVNKKTSFCK